MDSPVCLREIGALVFIGVGIRSSNKRESDMHATTVAVDLAKSVFQIAVADEHWRIVETQRLTRTQFERWFVNRSVGLVVMEACGSAHHWARWLNGLGIDRSLLPAQYVRAYVRRNKTDATDAAALLEAARASDLRPVRVKSVEQQALQGPAPHSLAVDGHPHLAHQRPAGLLPGVWHHHPQGARTGIEAIGRVLADPQSAVPELIRHTAGQCCSKKYGCWKRASPRSSDELSHRGPAKPGLHAAAVGAWHRAAHCHRDGGGHLGRCDALYGCTPLR
jgi:hypothetical protein